MPVPFEPDPNACAFVCCRGTSETSSCGDVALTRSEYERQLDQRNLPWQCPKCGATADYNDTLSEAAQGGNPEFDEDDEDDEDTDEDELDFDSDVTEAQEWRDFDEDC